MKKMKKITLSGLFILAAFVVVHAQDSTQPEGTKYNFSVYKKIRNQAIQKRMVSVLVKGDVAKIREEIKNLGGIFKYSSGDIASVRIPANAIKYLVSKNFVQRIDGSDAKLEVLNDQMIYNNNIYLLHQGMGLPQAYNGEGVCMGIIDEGIDVSHKDLRDSLGHTRVRWLWDQRLPLDSNYTPPEYNYGQNFTNTQIDNFEAAAVVDHDYSHGTHVTGIAAGNGLALNNYKGVAPKADIVFVAVNTNTTDDDFLTNLSDAVRYVFEKADSLHEPCAINISLGTYFGSHDGMDLQAQVIDNLISEKNGRFISCAAGNEGGAFIHLQTKVTPDSAFTWFGGYNTTQTLYFQLWADSADLANVEWMVGADQTTPSYSYRGGTSFRFATAILGDNLASVYNDTNRIGRVETFVTKDTTVRTRYSIECLITPDSANYVWRFMTKGTGKYDLWSYDLVYNGLPDSSDFPPIVKYKMPDTDQNIVSSFTCSPKVITVGSYINRNLYTDMNYDIVDTNWLIGSRSTFSSNGPTRDGRIKPEITATGQWLCSCGAEYDLASLRAVVPTQVCAGGEHRIGTGTSMASPVVAGTAALYLQKNPNASYQEVKDAILRCPKLDQFTGSSLPNNQWGYGKLDAYKTVAGCTVGIVEADAYASVIFENYPNPFSDFTNIRYDFYYSDKPVTGALITISDAVGRKVRDVAVTGNEGNVRINRNEIGSGVYFYSLIIDGKVIRTNKLVVL